MSFFTTRLAGQRDGQARELYAEGVTKNARFIATAAAGSSGTTELDISYLPAAAEVYNISPDIRDYILVPCSTVVSSLPNTNGDSMTQEELLRFNPQQGRIAYKTWIGKPTFLEHCFPGDTPIRVEDGHKPIKDIKVGDLVMTHDGTYSPVTTKFVNGKKRVARIWAAGIGGCIKATANHPFFVVGKGQIFGKFDEVTGTYKKNLRWDSITDDDIIPHWRPVTDIYKGDYLVKRIDIGGDISVDPNFAFLVGAFLAEGSYTKNDGKGDNLGKKLLSGLVFTLGSHEHEFRDEIVNAALALGYKPIVKKHSLHKNVLNISIYGAKLARHFHSLVGEYSHEKYLRGELRQWDVESLKHMLGGYISGDGCTSYNRMRCVTVSKALALDLQLAFARCGIPATITYTAKAGKEMMIKHPWRDYGPYKVRDVYHIGVAPKSIGDLMEYTVGKEHLEIRNDRKGLEQLIVVGDYLLVPVNKIDFDYDVADVYNLEVENQHTYTAHDFIVHNCNQLLPGSKGLILDSYLAPLPQYGLVKVCKLLAFDRSKDAQLTNAIMRNMINTYSMGVNFMAYRCTITGRMFTSEDTPGEFTEPGRPPYVVMVGGKRKVAYRQLIMLEGFETSAVATPAYFCALSDTVMDVRTQKTTAFTHE